MRPESFRRIRLAASSDFEEVRRCRSKSFKILYGSQARGQARSDSDIDVLLVVRDDSDYADRIWRTSAAVSALSLQHDVVISRAFVSRERFEREQTPFLLNVHREGVPV